VILLLLLSSPSEKIFRNQTNLILLDGNRWSQPEGTSKVYGWDFVKDSIKLLPYLKKMHILGAPTNGKL